MKPKKWTQFRMRIPPELHDKLKRDASAGYRTMNAEVVMIFEKHFAETEKASGALGSNPDASGK
ncbi:Arc family DNA-binding protein [Acetobacter sacchari]|uniref:Arc family DNA-binding protein n=1 Tax=Acetobacter sacchari TaxID=2661687 RepID=A0ABS3LXH3_9PROT|nr:Arc family DNA-binding protein [Acetobacter sacchari]MBO1360619.1 Arc family DNA-binding protein [Acetobacter sacchari]